MNFLLRAFVVNLVLAAPLSAAKFPEPYSYTKPVSKKFIFVQLGDASLEEKAPASAQKEFAELRKKYAATGLYAIDSTMPLWTLDGYAPYDSTFVVSDGEHLIRLEGLWWRTKDWPMQRRLASDVELAQLAGPAVSFYRNGKLLKQYDVQDLVANPRELPHSPEHVLWAAGTAINETNRRAIVNTQDARQAVFYYTTGDLIEIRVVGLGNPMASRMLAVAGLSSLLILGAWIYLAFGRRRVTAS